MEGLDKLTKAELIAKLEEHSSTEVAAALSQRDMAIAERDKATAESYGILERVTDLEAKLGGAVSAEDKEELERQVQDLSERLAANELTKGDDRPVVKVGDEQFLIVPRAVLIDGQKVPARELARLPEVLAQLVKDGSYVLKNVKLIAAEKAQEAEKAAAAKTA